MSKFINIKNIIEGGSIQVAAFVAQVVSIFFSFIFFYEINPFFGVVIVLFEWVTFFYIPRINLCNDRRVKLLMGVIVATTCSFSVFGVVANGYNFISRSNDSQYKIISNPEYVTHSTDKANKIKLIETYKKELDSYPTFAEYSKDVPDWEYKTDINKNYIDGKDRISAKIESAQKDIDKMIVPDKEIKTKVKTSGSGLIMSEISRITSLSVGTIILIMVLVVAVILQLIILTARLYKKVEPEGDNFKTKILETKTNVLDGDILDQSKNCDEVLNESKNEVLNESKILDQQSKIEVLNENLRPTKTQSETANYTESKKFKTKILDQNEQVLDQSKNAKVLNFNKSKTEILDLDQKILDQIKTYLFDTYSKNEKVKKFQSKFCLNLSAYRKALKQLKAEGIIYTENKNTYMARSKMCKSKS